ncbi:MAG: hypothetical protein ABIO46_07660 [Chitinophagales bacterium]
MFRNLYFVMSALLFLVACNKDSNDTPLESFRVSEIIYYPLHSESLADTNHLIYDNENHLVKTEKYNASVLISYSEMIWLDSQLQEIQQFDPDPVSNQFLPGYHAINFYDSTGNLTMMFQEAAINDTFHFYYSAGQLVKITSGLVTQLNYDFKYLSGNVSSVIRYQVENGSKLFIDSIAYLYDGRVNPFYDPAFIFFDIPFHKLVSWLSKNNLVGEYAYQKINGEWTEKYSVFNILQYNSYNYPSLCLKFPRRSGKATVTNYLYD